MITIEIPDAEYFNEETMSFSTIKGSAIRLEHSLVSVSKWEEKWEKPFLHRGDQMTMEELLDYVKCMTITQNVPDDVYKRLTSKNLEDIKTYIDRPMTATTFRDKNSRPGRELVTAEIIYYWMISLNIPMECQKWHLNKLLTLIKVCSIKNAPDKKMSVSETLRNNDALNKARRMMLKSKG